MPGCLVKFVPLYESTLAITGGAPVGRGPFGERYIGEGGEGTFEGARLRGRMRPGGSADWIAMTDTYAHLDVRLTFETHDGAFIYVQYGGKLELTERVRSALAGEGGTDFGEQYFFITPRMQTGDPRYWWVNNVVCVGEGRLLPGRVDYRVFEVANG